MSPALGDSSQAPMMNAFVAASTQSLLTPQVTLSGWMFPWSSRLQVQVQLELEPSQGAAAPRARRRRRSGAPRTTPRGGARGARAEARASWYSVRATMARRSEDSLNAVVGLFVIVVTITTVVLIFVIGQNKGRWKEKVTVSADFRQVSGLKRGSVVQLEGVEIGAVIDRQFIELTYPCDPETEDRGRFGHGRTDACNDSLFCAPEGRCAELETYSFNKELHAPCEEDAQCPEGEVCLTTDFRRRYRKVLWTGGTGVCDGYVTDHNRIRVVMSLYAESMEHVRDDSRANISQNGVLGDQLVQISIGRGEPIPPGGRIQTEPAFSEIVENTRARLEGTFGKVEDAIGGIAELAAAMGDPAKIRGIQGMLANADEVVRATAEGKGLLGALLNDDALIADFGASLRGVRSGAKDLGAVLRRAESARQAVDRDFEPMVVKGREAMAKISSALRAARDPSSRSTLSALLYDPEGRSIAAVSEALAGVRRVAAGLNEGEGTLGRLIRDPKVYDDLVEFFRGYQRDKVVQFLIRWVLKREKAEEAEK